MKRLTGRAPDGTAYLYNMGGTNAAIDRLAAYEDTGLEPEELGYIARAKRGEHMVTDEELRQAGVSRAEINALEEIAAVIAEGRPIALMPRWIPVTERLPEQSGAYLVILYTVPDVARLYYYYAPNEEFGQTRSGVWCAETVTHWMPLPEPPEEVTQ